MKRFALWLLICIMTLTSVSAAELVINSKDWKDVYSGMQYGVLTGTVPHFLTSDRHATIIWSDLVIRTDVELLSSKNSPFVIGFEAIAESNGIDATELVFDDLSIELAKKLPDINRFIVVDDSYGYNAIAVGPYAALTEAYVLFADESNIDDISDFLETKTVENILIYGNVDREVLDALEVYSTEIINVEGDRFANNVEIVKKFKEITDARQVVMSNGEFIEAELMTAGSPLLFIGKDNVPDKIQEYIKESNIEVGVLIGNDLVGTATVVRRQTGISTFVKFARSSRVTTGPINEVEGLDIFFVPTVNVELSIESIKYNSLSQTLEVTLRNDEEVAAYSKGTFTITSGDFEQTVGDVDAIFIDHGDLKTIIYDVEPIVGSEDIVVDAFIIYGESKGALEKILEASIVVDRIELLDDTAISLEKVEYHKPKEEFIVYVKNIGEEDVFVDTEIVDLEILGVDQTFSAEEIIELKPGQTKKSYIEVSLDEEDFEENEEIRVRAYYGQTETALGKVIEGQFALVIKSVDIMMYIPIVIIIILIFLILLAKRRKKKEEDKK